MRLIKKPFKMALWVTNPTRQKPATEWPRARKVFAATDLTELKDTIAGSLRFPIHEKTALLSLDVCMGDFDCIERIKMPPSYV